MVNRQTKDADDETLGVPLQIQRHDFDYGFMLGLGVDFRLLGVLGLVLEVDSALSKNLDWGSMGLPVAHELGSTQLARTCSDVWTESNV